VLDNWRRTLAATTPSCWWRPPTAPGKTTRVPLALLDAPGQDKKIIVLEPRADRRACQRRAHGEDAR